MNIPPAMKMASIWCVWFFISLGSIGWGLFVVLEYFGVKDKAADWVQAFGSILAICGAAAFPYIHASKIEENKQRSMLEVLSELSDEASEELWLLSNIFIRPDREYFLIKQYVSNGVDRNWAGLVSAIDQFRVVDFPPEMARRIGYIRNAVSYGEFVVGQLPVWIKERCSHPEVVETLRSKRDLLDVARSSLPESKRDPRLAVFRTAGRQAEFARPPASPVNVEGCKLYRRFVWGDAKDVIPEEVYVQMVFPYGDEFPSMAKVPSANPWSSLEEANEAAVAMAKQRIDWLNMNC